jgi:hypothetical protein
VRIALIVVIAFAFYSYSSACSAQNDGFQSVSGDIARNWLNNFLAENPKPTENEKGSLWSWGSAPRGSRIVDGRLGLTAGTSAAGSSMSGSSAAGASAAEYTPCQEDAIEGVKIGFKMGKMYALAQQGHNISGFNAEVDKYNAWAQQNFGDDPNLMMPKMQETGDGMPGYIPVPRITSTKPIHAIDASFNRMAPPLIPVYEGRIFDMPAGAWYTTYGPYLSHHHRGDYYGAMGWV